MIYKILAIFNYLGAALLLLLSFIGGVFLYPIIYWLKDYSISRKYPIWWWFDDEDGLYGAKYWRDSKGITKNNWWVSCLWCAWRNPMWNAHTKIIPKTGTEISLSEYGKLIHNNVEVSLMNSAVFHYVNSNGTWNGNTGDLLSERYSYLGWAFVWFKKEQKRYFRFSFAKQIIKNYLGLEIQIGTFHRHLFKIKLKWNNVTFENGLKEITVVKHSKHFIPQVFKNYANIKLPKREFFYSKVEKNIINY